ncbi:MAG: hypothetical protein AAF191_02740 [Verrucomicrobiota bacterium]
MPTQFDRNQRHRNGAQAHGRHLDGATVGEGLPINGESLQSRGDLANDPAAIVGRAERAEARGDYEAAVHAYREAQEYGHFSQNPSQQIEFLIAQSRCHQQLNQLEAAHTALKQAESIVSSSAARASLDLQQVEIDTALGHVFRDREDFTSAVQHLVSAIRRYESNGARQPKHLSHLFATLARCHCQAKDWASGLEAALRGLTTLEECKDPTEKEEMTFFQLLSAIAYQKGEVEAAIRHLLEAYRRAETISSQADLVELEMILATIYSQYGYQEQAEQWFRTAISRQEMAKGPSDKSFAQLSLNFAHFLKQTKPEEADQYFAVGIKSQLAERFLTPPTKALPQ